MAMSWQEKDVRSIYAGIVMQAIKDIKDPPELGTWQEVRRFLRSEWGQHVCDITGLSADFIPRKLKLNEKIKQANEIRLMFENDKTDVEIAKTFKMPLKQIKRFRKSI